VEGEMGAEGAAEAEAEAAAATFEWSTQRCRRVPR